MPPKSNTFEFIFNDSTISNNRRIFVDKRFRNNEIVLKLKSSNKEYITRCEKCGSPLRVHKDEKKSNDIDVTIEIKFANCIVCRRENIFSWLLNISYVLSVVIFIVSFIGVIFDQLTLDLSLLIGCLELIFLMFFGRFLEEAVFFGLSQKEKVLSGLYRFSISGELQAFDIAMQYFEKLDENDLSSDLIKSILQTIVYQSNNIPSDWYDILSDKFNISTNEFIQILSHEIDETDELDYLDNLIANASPQGLTSIAQISFASNNLLAIEHLDMKLQKVLHSKNLENEWLRELFISKEIYEIILLKAKKTFTLQKINESLENYDVPKVPTIDVVEGFAALRRNPLFRYLFRIFTYIVLAFIIGLIYQLID